MKTYIILFITCLFFLNCKDTKETQIVDPNFIVNESIQISGGATFNNATVEFDFRDKHYKSFRKNGKFALQRSYKDSINKIKDVVSNNGFQRFIDGLPIAVPDTMATKYSNSVNSVHYFSLLPFGLNDEAVNKEYLGKTLIKNKEYHKIKVFFNEEEGGDDFDDEFIYWINTKTYKVDYLAYEFHVNGGGLRFREAYNERIIEGLRFVDYKNYKPENKATSLFNLDKLFETNKLTLLSNIELENVTVIKGK